MVLLKLRLEVWLSLELLGGTQGASRLAPGKSIILLSYEGEHGIALESRQGNRASIHVEWRISRGFLSYSRKPWIPLNCEGDLRELLMVPVVSQKYCRVGKGLSGLH